MKTSRLPLALLLVSLPVFAAGDAYPRAKMELKLPQYSVNMRDFTFPSGLRVIFQEDHSQPVVSITSVTDRGSTSDPPGIEGVAHVCEHMWFRSVHKDAEGKPLPKVWDLLEEMGANLNAFTADDQTVYMTVTPVDKLVALLRLEGLRVREGAAGITNDVLLVEREVVRNELRMRYENNNGAVFGQLGVRLYPKDHPYGRAAYAGIGSHDTLNAITLADVQKFFHDNYKPENTTIFVVGDFDVNKSNEYLAEIGGDLMVDPKAPNAPISLVEPKPRITGPAIEPPPPVSPAEVKGVVSSATVAKVHGAVDKPIVVLGWSTPSGWRESDVLQQAAASQLTVAIYQELNPSWTYNTDAAINNMGCFAQPGVQGSSVACIIELGAGQDGVKVAGQAIDGLYRVWTSAEDELSRQYLKYLYDYGKYQGMAQTLNQVDLISSLDTARVTGAAMFTHYTGDLQYFSRQFEWINKLEPSSVQKFAQKYLTRERAVAVVMEPYEEGDIVTDSSDAGYRGAQKDDEVNSIMDPKDLTPDLIAKTVILPDTSKITESKLPNGMRVVVMPYTNGPLVRAQLIFDGGSASVASEPLFGTFAGDMWSNRSWAIDSLRLAGEDHFQQGEFTTSWYGDAAAGNLPDLLYVFRQRIDNFNADTNGKLDWIKGQKDAIVDSLDDPFAIAQYDMTRRIAAGHPIAAIEGRSDHAAIDAVGKHAATDVEKYYASVFRPDHATLVVVGNITQAEAEDAAKTYFGGWEGWHAQAGRMDLATKWDPWGALPDRQVVVYDKENASQTQVTYACQLPTLKPEEFAAARVLGEVLSGQTWLALREQTGASYGAYAFADVRQRGGLAALYMSSLVQNDAAPLAVKSFLEIGEKAKTGSIDEKLLAIRKYAVAQQFVQGQQSTGQMLTRLVGAYSNGLDKNYFKTYQQSLANVGVAQLEKLLDRCVGHEIVTAVGPGTVIGPELEAAGVKYENYDWKAERVAYATKYNLKGILKAEEKKEKEKESKK